MEDESGVCRQGGGIWRSLTDGDFGEEEVCDVLHEREDYAPKSCESLESPVSVKTHLPSAARMIPRTPSFYGASSITSSDETCGLNQQSAPVHIPDWSKVSGRKSRVVSSKNCGWAWLGSDDDASDQKAIEGVNDDDECNSMVPPHEILARRQARSQISSFSVIEGVGRKLRGRDLRQVRNVVLTKTGFLE